VERLSSQYLGQIVQILINLEHFELACHELELLLAAARSQNSTGTSIALRATEKFKSNKKAAEKRIFEVVNSKIDDLIETAEYEWMAPHPPTEPSNYMQTLTRFLSNIMNSTLLGLPTEIKELIYFDALSHAANMILVNPSLSAHHTAFYQISCLLTFLQGSTSRSRSEDHQSQWCHRIGQGCRIPYTVRGQPECPYPA
jgi:hypothetical protein